jgi:hypothetical protein
MSSPDVGLHDESSDTTLDTAQGAIRRKLQATASNIASPDKPILHFTAALRNGRRRIVASDAGILAARRRSKPPHESARHPSILQISSSPHLTVTPSARSRRCAGVTVTDVRLRRFEFWE